MMKTFFLYFLAHAWTSLCMPPHALRRSVSVDSGIDVSYQHGKTKVSHNQVTLNDRARRQGSAVQSDEIMLSILKHKISKYDHLLRWIEDNKTDDWRDFVNKLITYPDQHFLLKVQRKFKIINTDKLEHDLKKYTQALRNKKMKLEDNNKTVLRVSKNHEDERDAAVTPQAGSREQDDARRFVDRDLSRLPKASSSFAEQLKGKSNSLSLLVSRNDGSKDAVDYHVPKARRIDGTRDATKPRSLKDSDILKANIEEAFKVITGRDKIPSSSLGFIKAWRRPT